MSRWIAIGAGLLLCAALGLRELACNGASPSEPRAARDREPTSHAAPIEATAVDRGEAVAGGTRAARGPTDAGSAVKARGEVPLMPPTGHFQAMLRAFESESRDSRWAGEQEARITRLLAESGFPDDAYDRGDVICRRTTCRLSLRVVDDSEADMLALMKLAAAVQTRGGLSLAYGAAEVDGDKVRITVLTPSEGTSLGDAGAR